MRNMFTVILLSFASLVLVSCAPEVGSKEWCEEMKEKSKADWSLNEAADFTEHCIF